MTPEEKAVEKLMDELSSVYCDTCKNELMDENCGYCVRKEMGWGISEDEAWKIVKMIKKTLEENGQ